MTNSTPLPDHNVLDIRPIPPRDRHPMIFDWFDNLEPGEAFILVNDHEPRPLYYQFAAERQDEFTWDNVEEGPDVWQVRIGKP